MPIRLTSLIILSNYERNNHWMKFGWDGKRVAKAACGYQFFSETYSTVTAVSWFLTPPFFFSETMNGKRHVADMPTLSHACGLVKEMQLFPWLGSQLAYISTLGQPTASKANWVYINFIFNLFRFVLNIFSDCCVFW